MTEIPLGKKGNNNSKDLLSFAMRDFQEDDRVSFANNESKGLRKMPRRVTQYIPGELTKYVVLWTRQCTQLETV